jgi:hypothetical protein
VPALGAWIALATPVVLAVVMAAGLLIWALRSGMDWTQVASLAQSIPPWVGLVSTLGYAAGMCYGIAHMSVLWPRLRWIQVAVVGVVLVVPTVLSIWVIPSTVWSGVMGVLGLIPALLMARYMATRRVWLGVSYGVLMIGALVMGFAMSAGPLDPSADPMRLAVLGAVVGLMQLGSMGCQLFFALDLTRNW